MESSPFTVPWQRRNWFYCTGCEQPLGPVSHTSTRPLPLGRSGSSSPHCTGSTMVSSAARMSTRLRQSTAHAADGSERNDRGLLKRCMHTRRDVGRLEEKIDDGKKHACARPHALFSLQIQDAEAAGRVTSPSRHGSHVLAAGSAGHRDSPRIGANVLAPRVPPSF